MTPAFSASWRRLQSFRPLPFVILPIILAVHLFFVLSLHPTKLFGLQQDDALYFSSAKALAEGRGYILPGLPGTPAATKYPILYPWILSWAWRANPHFPANLSTAAGITYFFALAAIFLTYFFCRLPLKLSRIESLAVTAFCALHPDFVFYSARLMTDVPFAALALAFLLCAWKAVESETAPRWAVLAGIFADLAVLMRMAGVAFIAGLLLALVLRRRWKPAISFLAACVPAIWYFSYQGWLRAPSVPPAPFSNALPGWQQTWYYFTSYTSFRQLDSPNLNSAITLLLNQILYLFSAIAGYFVAPLSDSNIALWLVSCVVVVTLLAPAALKSFANLKVAPEIGVFFAYVGLLAGWDYVEWTRFLLPFFPLLMVLISSQGYRCYTLLRGSGVDWLSRSLLVALLCCAGVLAAVTAWNYASAARRSFGEMGRQREASVPEKQEAYDWIRSHTELNDLLITTEYGTTYLYTGRQSINFTVPMPYGVYDQRRLQTDLDHMPDVALALHARYWVMSTHDSQSQLRAFEQPLRERLERWEGLLPRVFRTTRGTIHIHDLRCLHAPGSDGCPAGIADLLTLRRPGASR